MAGFGARLGARLLDSFLYALTVAPLGIAAFLLFRWSFDDCYTVRDQFGSSDLQCPPGAPEAAPLVAGIVCAVLAFFLYFFLYVRGVAKTGQTWGRRALGIKVVDAATGAPPGWGKAIGRSLFTYFSGFLMLGYLWMLWDSNRQTWHDKVASTFVVKV